MVGDRAVRTVHLDVAPLEAPFGVSVHLPGELKRLFDDPAQCARLRQTLAEHHLLVFNRPLDELAHIALLSVFGRVLTQGPRALVGDQAPPTPYPPSILMTNVSDGVAGDAPALGDHHEFAYLSDPLAGVSLYALDVGADAAPTRFVNGCLAYDALDAATKEQLHRLQALFVAEYDPAIRGRAGRHRDLAVDPTYPRAVHPVVVAHPVTNRPVLYVNRTQIDRIVGLPADESEALLQKLFEVVYRPEHTYEHHYRPHDLVVWDNLALQHGRPALAAGTPRQLRRIVFGDRAPWEQWPNEPAL